MTQKFIYPLSVTITSILACLIFIYCIITFIPWEETFVYNYLPIIVLALLLYSAVSIPQQVSKDREGVSLRLLTRTLHFPESEYSIEQVRELPLWSKSIRLWGSGGLFGFTGYFYLSGRGIFRLYQTNTKQNNYLLITNRKTKRRVYITWDF